VRLLAAREHSRKELQGKLAARGYAEDDIQQVLDDLAQRNLQSDDRFAENYTELRVRKGNGPLRIRAELRERGIGDSLIAVNLEHYTSDWPSVMRRVHDAKYGAQPPGDQREMARRARFLEYRGFPGELIGRLLFNNDF